MSETKEFCIDRILNLRSTQLKRVLELIHLHQKSTDKQESAEIRETLAEILFMAADQYQGTIISMKRKKNE